MNNLLAEAVLAALDGEALDILADRLAPRLLARLDVRENGYTEDRWLTTAEAAAYVGRTTSALHKLTAARSIPFSQDGPGARCYFRRSDLDAWMASR